MASGSSRGRGQGSAGAGALHALANPYLADLPAAELVVHLHRGDRRGSDFADVALVLAVRERRLAEAETRIRTADADVAVLQDRIRATDMTVAGLQDRIRALELRVANAEALARDRTVAGEDDESQAGDHLAASDIEEAAELTGGEIRASRDLEVMVPEHGDGDNDMPSPIPLMRIDAIPVPVSPAPALPDDELIEEGEVERVVLDVAVPRGCEVAEAGVVVSEAIAGKRKRKQASDLPLPLDDLRVTVHKVSEEEADGEDVVASPDGHSQEEQPARSTKKARRQKETPFYNMVFKALKEKEILLKRREKEAAAKKAAAAASKQLNCTCWWSDSGDGKSSQN